MVTAVGSYQDEVQYVYRLFLKLVDQYNIPGPWTSPEEFTSEFVSNFQNKQPLTPNQSRFFNFLLDNRQTLHELKTGLRVNELDNDRLLDNIQVQVIQNENVNNQVLIRPLDGLTHESSSKIIHVVNMIPITNSLDGTFKTRIKLGVQSIEHNNHPRVIPLACSVESIKLRKQWRSHRLTRSAKTDGLGARHLAYLHDLLDAALECCDDDSDYILYSNLDCAITPSIYEQILTCGKPVVEFHRRDVELKSNLHKLFTQPYELKRTGVDAFATRAGVYRDYIKPLLPDMLIGEPHWDTVLSHLAHRENISCKSTTGLYHPIHEQAWSSRDLSAGGKHNKQHLYNSIEYGIIPDQVLELPIDKLNIIINQSTNTDTVSDLCNRLSGQEIIVVNYTDLSNLPGHELPFVNYHDIHITSTMHGVDQTNAIINKLVLCNEHCENFDIYILSDDQITVAPTYTISYNNYKPMNIYKNNNKLYCYLNDDGLLERCGNHD